MNMIVLKNFEVILDNFQEVQTHTNGNYAQKYVICYLLMYSVLDCTYAHLFSLMIVDEPLCQI